MHSYRRRWIAFACVGWLACKRPPTSSAPPPHPPTHANADATSGTPPSNPSAVALDPPAAANEFRDAAQYLPQGEIAGWRQSGSVIRSAAADLFQQIDGAAVAYERYGLHDYAKTDYRRPGSTLVATVELYRFDAPLGAFGRYSLMLSDGRDPASMQPQAVQFGGGGYQGSTQLAFWKSRLLVTVSVSDTSDEPNEAQVNEAARQVLPILGNALAQAIPDEGAPPASPLPHDNLVWGGSTYLADGVLGIDGTGAAWVGLYRTPDGKRYRLAIFTRGTTAEVGAVMARLRGTAPTSVPGLGDEAFSVANETTGEIVAARRGTTVIAVADTGIPNATALPRADKVAAVRAALGATR